MKRYNPKDIESKWQKIWAENKTYEVTEDSSKSKSYVTAMFPYPSGAGLHVGHVRNYSITDAIARFERQNGRNVLTAIGWDGFGLPAENYAIKTGTPPAVSTAQNIANFKSQLQRLGMSYDWSRELNTTDPDYYKWTQWLFIKLFEKGLAYQKESLQWWCPHDKTVLANEQVEGGRCWRCGNEVVKKSMKQWFFKITDYADALLDGIEDLDWPDKIRTMQRNWIGRSKGASITFKVRSETLKDAVVEVFTTRPDTLYGATFIVLAPEHPLVRELVTEEQREAVEAYVASSVKKSEIERQENKDKTGVPTGAYAINPATNEPIPIWVADYVLSGYGTGAIMAVPGHDERDYAFARKFDLPVNFVVEPTFGEAQGDDKQSEKVYVVLRNPKTQQAVVLDWGPRQKNFGGTMLIGGTVEDGEDHRVAAEREIREETGYQNVTFVKEAEFKGHGYFYSNVKDINVHASGKGMLFDLVDESRDDGNLDDGEKEKFTLSWQPLDAIATKLDDGVHEAMFRYLALDEPYHGEGVLIHSGPYDGMETWEARDKIVADLGARGVAQEKVNYKMRDWLISRQRYWGAPIPIIHCVKDGAVAVPEQDLPLVLPVVEHYEPDGSGIGVLGHATDWVNTTCPKCGGPAKRETDTMDGYVDSSWYLFRYADAHNIEAPWDPAKVNYWAPLDFYCGGDHAVAHLLYVRFWTRFFQDMGLLDFAEPIKKLVYNGYIYAADGTKMSKSKGNVIDPLEVIDSGYGADALRTYELFIAPYEQDTQWDAGGVAGTYRFLNRVWTLTQEYLASVASDQSSGASDEAEAIKRSINKAIKKVTGDLSEQSFNTATAALMECVNNLYKIKATDTYAARDTWRQALTSLVQLLAPFAPHISEELWQQLGHEGSVHLATWPVWDEAYVTRRTVTIAVQVNGKLRGEVTVPSGATEAEVTTAAQAIDKVATQLQDKTLRKTIYVPGKIVNFVV